MKKEERIRELHIRMKARRSRREKRLTALLGFFCLFPLAGLFLLAKGSSGLMGRSAEMYTGSTMLLGNYGGYVLVGVIAFLAGIVLTVIIRSHQENTGRDESKKEDSP